MPWQIIAMLCLAAFEIGLVGWFAAWAMPQIMKARKLNKLSENDEGSN